MSENVNTYALAKEPEPNQKAYLFALFHEHSQQLQYIRKSVANVGHNEHAPITHRVRTRTLQAKA